MNKADKAYTFRKLIDSLADYLPQGATYNEIGRLFFVHGINSTLEKPYGIYQGSKRDYVFEKLMKAKDSENFFENIASLVGEITIFSEWADVSTINWALKALGFKQGDYCWKAPKKGSKIYLDSNDVSGLEFFHPKIEASCRKLYKDKHYSEAIEKSFKIVRDRLRELTGFETGSEAFGKGRLKIKGAIASHVEQDFNEGVKFLCMAIDKFRNEKAHSANVVATDPMRVYEYLRLSSLAMHLLDSVEEKNK
jgi:uncharacterized protein (TIGR02391 family)